MVHHSGQFSNNYYFYFNEIVCHISPKVAIQSDDSAPVLEISWEFDDEVNWAWGRRWTCFNSSKDAAKVVFLPAKACFLHKKPHASSYKDRTNARMSSIDEIRIKTAQEIINSRVFVLT